MSEQPVITEYMKILTELPPVPITVHFGVIVLNGDPATIELPDGFMTDGDSWLVWGKPFDGTLHVQYDSVEDPEEIDVAVRTKLLEYHLERQIDDGLDFRLADYSVISDKAEWSKDQLIVLGGGSARYIVLPLP